MPDRRACLFWHMRLDDRLALRRQLVEMLRQALDDAATARLDTGTVFLEVGLACLALGRRLCERRPRQERGPEQENAYHCAHGNPLDMGWRRQLTSATSLCQV